MDFEDGWSVWNEDDDTDEEAATLNSYLVQCDMTKDETVFQANQ